MASDVVIDQTVCVFIVDHAWETEKDLRTTIDYRLPLRALFTTWLLKSVLIL